MKLKGRRSEMVTKTDKVDMERDTGAGINVKSLTKLTMMHQQIRTEELHKYQISIIAGEAILIFGLPMIYIKVTR